MKKIMFGLLALLSGCTTETVSSEYGDESGNIIKKAYIGGNFNNLEMIEYKDHEYLVYHSGSGVAMLHLESCKCKSVNK